jgi:hypothetical protein
MDEADVEPGDEATSSQQESKMRLTWQKFLLPFPVPTKQAYLIDSLGLERDIHITVFCDRQDSSLYT